MDKVDTSTLTLEEVRALYEAEVDAHNEDLAKAEATAQETASKLDKLNKDLANARIEALKHTKTNDKEEDEPKLDLSNPEELVKAMLDKQDKTLI